MRYIKRVNESPRLFNTISWGITVLIILLLAGITAWRFIPASVPVPSSASPTEPAASIQVDGQVDTHSEFQITRQITLDTIVPAGQETEVREYTVERGDSLYGIASDYKIKPETLYWANFEVFNGSPDSLSPGDVLKIPPVDGIYYQWQEGDSFEAVADGFGVEPDVIVDYPGNNIDLTDPVVPIGSFVMIPGGTKDDQPLFITTVTRYSSDVSQACGGGYVGRNFFTWPTPLHTLSGYDWGDGGGSHRGIDLSAQEGTPVYAADTGVVTKASVGEYNNGYGNVIMLDHGNGFITVYAHLSAVYVGLCQSVLGGSTIGAAGNTGNSSGAHLHFEIRLNGAAQNPWVYLP